MRSLGVYTGAVLNKAGDNKWFSLLCKLPRFSLDESSPDAENFDRAVGLLERAMTGQLGPDRADRRLINELIERWATMKRQHPLPDDRTVEWVRGHAASLRPSRDECPEGAPMWGWKEPNSHLFLPHMRNHFGDRLRYVHVIRHGIYMAYSENQSQAMRWGPQFGLAECVPKPTPTQSLDYWIASNELAVSRGRAMPEGSFLLLNHDDLCAEPRQWCGSFRRVPRLLAHARGDGAPRLAPRAAEVTRPVPQRDAGDVRGRAPGAGARPRVHAGRGGVTQGQEAARLPCPCPVFSKRR